MQRKSFKEDMQKIHSESQRMVRESTVDLPYHKVIFEMLILLKFYSISFEFDQQPKQRSLTDFLNRKRVSSDNCHLKPRVKDIAAVA